MSRQCAPPAGLHQLSPFSHPLPCALPRPRSLNKCGAISPRFDIAAKDIEAWVGRLLPSRQFGHIILTTSQGIMDHEEARCVRGRWRSCMQLTAVPCGLCEQRAACVRSQPAGQPWVRAPGCCCTLNSPRLVARPCCPQPEEGRRQGAGLLLLSTPSWSSQQPPTEGAGCGGPRRAPAPGSGTRRHAAALIASRRGCAPPPLSTL